MGHPVYVTNKFDFLLYGLRIRGDAVRCSVMNVRLSGAPSVSLAACSEFSIYKATNTQL